MLESCRKAFLPASRVEWFLALPAGGDGVGRAGVARVGINNRNCVPRPLRLRSVDFEMMRCASRLERCARHGRVRRRGQGETRRRLQLVLKRRVVRRFAAGRRRAVGRGRVDRLKLM